MARNPIPLKAWTAEEARAAFISRVPHAEVVLQAAELGLAFGEAFAGFHQLAVGLKALRAAAQKFALPTMASAEAGVRNGIARARFWNRRPTVFDNVLGIASPWASMLHETTQALRHAEQIRSTLASAAPLRSAAGRVRIPKEMLMAAFARTAAMLMHQAPLFEDDFVRLEVALKLRGGITDANTESRAAEQARDRWRKRNGRIDELCSVLLAQANAGSSAAEHPLVFRQIDPTSSSRDCGDR